VEKWLLNYAKNANKPIPVVSAITTKRLNALRRLASMRSPPNHVTSHQKKRKIEGRYDPEQLSAPCDGGLGRWLANLSAEHVIQSIVHTSKGPAPTSPSIVDNQAACAWPPVLRDPANPANLLPIYAGDPLHPNDAGYQVMGNIVDLDAILRDIDKDH
jgi:hypothetical protein